MVNPDMNGYTKTLNHRKMLRKTQKLLKTKRILKPIYKLSGGPGLAFTEACRMGQLASSAAAGRPRHSKNFH